MIEAIAHEYLLNHQQYDLPWETVYFGGGTPSVILPDKIHSLMSIFKENGGIKNDAEITLEANPEDVTHENLSAWKLAGINRLSIGVQSLNDKTLQQMNRKHSSIQSLEAVEKALKSGFSSVNIDLIFGGFDFHPEEWAQTLDWAFTCGADHISAYGLTVEPKTLLNKQVFKGLIPGPEDEELSRAYEFLFTKAVEKGWDFYEISNLSKPGCRAKHNSNYWTGNAYMGLGPSAHSFDGKNRRHWNVSDNRKYMLQATEKSFQPTEETLTSRDLYNELLMISLRTKEGLNKKAAEKCMPGIWEKSKSAFLKWENTGMANLQDQSLTLTLKGRLFADGITADLML